MMKIDKNLIVGLAEDDRAYRISKEFFYHYYVIDLKRRTVM